MTSPTNNVFDNQDTSSFLIDLGGAALVLVGVAACMYFGDMDFLTAVFCTVIFTVIFAIVAAFFSVAVAPFLLAAIAGIVAVGYILFGLVVALCRLLKLPFFEDVT